MKIVILLLLITGAFVAFKVSDKEVSNPVCTAVNVVIKPEVDKPIVSEATLFEFAGLKKLKGKKLTDINLKSIEQKAEKHPYIADASAYSNLDGAITLNVILRQPVLRVFNTRDQSFYVDKNGIKLPLPEQPVPLDILVANGYITEQYKADTISTKVVAELLKLSQYFEENPDQAALFSQVYVNANQELELVPIIGDQQILIGNTQKLAKKMEYLIAFYKSDVDWNKYESINLKYQNQIICKR